jgi:uncharacterized membrane protein
MPPKAERQGLAGRRLAAAVVFGVAVLVVALLADSGWTVALSAAWAAAALLTVASTWARLAPMDSEATAAHAQAEDYSRPIADLVVLGASVASLVSVGFALVEARHRTGTGKGLLIALAVAVVALSWLAVHFVFAVRYGDLYYGDPVGGVDFNEKDRPDYRDFAYFALTIGMTFQVSDTTITDKTLRRQVTRHALLSYLFGAVIVALAINSVASLLQ